MKTFNTRIITKHDSTDNWKKALSFIPLKGEVCIYEDYLTDTQGNYVPGLKVGDGTTPVVDLPFVDEVLKQKLLEHIENQEIHVTQQEKSFWNNKINCEFESEILIINRD